MEIITTKIKMKEWLKQNPFFKKCIKGYDIKDIEIASIKYLDKDHIDSFWYDTEIISLKFKDRLISIRGVGEIRIFKNGVLVYDCKERGDGFGFEVLNDKQLNKVNEENGFIWENNNWFDIEWRKEKDEFWDCDLSMVSDDVEEALCLAISQIKNDEFWDYGEVKE